LEPSPDFVGIAPGFDALADLITTAHADGIEVHAFVIMSAIWSKNPMFAPSPTLGPPINDQHVFNQHAWNKTTSTMRTGSDNWLTKSLAPLPTGVTFDGQRYGNDFWLDFGHPDAAAYTVDVLMHLVNNYAIDGLHLDRIRYPEFGVPAGQPAQTPANGTNVGYNSTSVARFNTRHDRTGNPAYGDEVWKQWRRHQVSNVVRRVYLNAIAAKPQLKISGALIATGSGPICAPGANCKTIWESNIRAEAYWRVYQDWRSWTEEGILDIAIPMNYKREHTPGQDVMYNEWNEWTKNQRYNRSTVIGIGNFLNAAEGNVRQVRRALATSAQGNNSDGVVFFSMATSNVAVTANPWSVPPGATTPIRSFADFARSLTTGKSGATLFEPNANDTGYQAIFSQPATIPVHSWKAAPLKGHLKGFARRANNTVLDTANVTITNLDNNTARTGATDGGGFYGGVDRTGIISRQGRARVRRRLFMCLERRCRSRHDGESQSRNSCTGHDGYSLACSA
ncbi:MAG: family 10 glycosylhydrolase, partial [Blastocatellia bacterium]|nr:family 10 glycosylhydrolase [Blastocatellia bacterium]